jgi:hypothetical protein
LITAIAPAIAVRFRPDIRRRVWGTGLASAHARCSKAWVASCVRF